MVIARLLSRNFTRFQCLSLISKRAYSSTNMPSALLFLAKGAEEMEAVITVDVLRRGGMDVTVAGVTGKDPVLCSRNVVVVPDISLEEAAKTEYDVVICPGGLEGANTLASNNKVGEMMKKQEAADKFVACICAAPIALKSHGVGLGKKVTSHPSVKDQLKDAYSYQEDRVVVDGKLITSRAPGTAFEFALAIVEALQGKEKRDSIVPPMLLKN